MRSSSSVAHFIRRWSGHPRQLTTVAILKKKCTVNFIAYYAGVLRVPGMD
jgi:hypothetical protein